MAKTKAKAARNEAVLTAARNYLDRGWQPVPIPYGEKAPKEPDWQHLAITPDNVEDYFDARRMNIGVRLGKASGGLTDVDLDCPEALALVDRFLPLTGKVFGRASRPRSHWLYITDLCETESKATLKFAEPPALGGATLVELRIGAGDKGAQTVFPPSTHPSGEAIGWDSEAMTPASTAIS